LASNPASVGEREDVIDALRGAALLGILLVNIQSFAWGVSAPSMGVLWDDATVLDSLTIYLTSLFLEYKIYPIFCFCFGYGFAIMAKRWRLASIGDDAVVKQRYQRRLNFMLVLGLSHGSLIWFGDILARYALAGHFLVTYIGKGPRILLRGIKRWGSITVIFTVTGGLLSALSSPPASLTDGEVDEIMKVFDVYARGDYLSTMLPRLYDYMWVLASWLLLFPCVCGADGVAARTWESCQEVADCASRFSHGGTPSIDRIRQPCARLGSRPGAHSQHRDVPRVDARAAALACLHCVGGAPSNQRVWPACCPRPSAHGSIGVD